MKIADLVFVGFLALSLFREEGEGVTLRGLAKPNEIIYPDGAASEMAAPKKKARKMKAAPKKQDPTIQKKAAPKKTATKKCSFEDESCNNNGQDCCEGLDCKDGSCQ
eukprot:CAMPEP_0183293444 /NCGR_PEP_ID=MMETSP0160_2-20130417/2126_1 /TAXON_ID=2839 ORGANISM="Odontella Sinensis, Strain Grunow 1884" /NCGR_SAMPLE_ID=MMETSP0160_2 /ASSEMBLY_ACC=CAM_ASM_000250 /LENGTH=106 /DNA_ID=CAMNT_0025454561 /DNA_START=81 /DNA_END=401 /DNA_ORIENTATION=-